MAASCAACPDADPAPAGPVRWLRRSRGQTAVEFLRKQAALHDLLAERHRDRRHERERNQPRPEAEDVHDRQREGGGHDPEACVDAVRERDRHDEGRGRHPGLHQAHERGERRVVALERVGEGRLVRELQREHQDREQHVGDADQAELAASLHQACQFLPRRSLVIVISDFLQKPEAVLAGIRHLHHDGHDVRALHVVDEGAVEPRTLLRSGAGELPRPARTLLPPCRERPGAHGFGDRGQRDAALQRLEGGRTRLLGGDDGPLDVQDIAALAPAGGALVLPGDYPVHDLPDLGVGAPVLVERVGSTDANQAVRSQPRRAGHTVHRTSATPPPGPAHPPGPAWRGRPAPGGDPP